MQLLCTRKLSPACHCARLSTIRSQIHPTLLTAIHTRARCALTHTNPTSHILICSRHCLRPIRIRPQHGSKFQTPSLLAAQSNPDLQSDPPVRCEVLFVGRCFDRSCWPQELANSPFYPRNRPARIAAIFPGIIKVCSFTPCVSFSTSSSI
jgi:hypothetical protein